MDKTQKPPESYRVPALVPQLIYIYINDLPNSLKALEVL